MRTVNKAVMGAHADLSRAPCGIGRSGLRTARSWEKTALAEILPEQDALDAALALLAEGEVVAIPTETVYGLAADATNGAAVARIFETKRRPRFNPLIAHVSGLGMAERHGVFDPLSRRLAERFWPGPLTLVVPKRAESPVHPLVTAGLDTLAMRHPRGFGERLIAAFGRPLAAPSANSSGRVSATTAQHVAADLGPRIRLVVDGGPTPVGVESTILKVEGETLRLLRPGGVPTEEIEAVAGRAVTRTRGAALEDLPVEELGARLGDDALDELVLHDSCGVDLLRVGPNDREGAARAVDVVAVVVHGDVVGGHQSLLMAANPPCYR